MKLKIDEYTVKTEKFKTNSNYGLSLRIFKDKKLIKGMHLKTDSSELEIVKNAIRLIEHIKTPMIWL